MSMIEVYRISPKAGSYYYAILATKKTWDVNGRTWRYYAPSSEKRYIGCFVESFTSGSGDGRTYEEVYIRDNSKITLHYDYDGNTCLIEADADHVEKDSPAGVPIDVQIR